MRVGLSVADCRVSRPCSFKLAEKVLEATGKQTKPNATLNPTYAQSPKSDMIGKFSHDILL